MRGGQWGVGRQLGTEAHHRVEERSAGDSGEEAEEGELDDEAHEAIWEDAVEAVVVLNPEQRPLTRDGALPDHDRAPGGVGGRDIQHWAPGLAIAVCTALERPQSALKVRR